MLKASVGADTVKRFIQIMSSAVYGESPLLPKNEDMIPQPLSPYAVAKLT